MKKEGDTMTGDLKVNTKIESPRVCIGNNCRTNFETQTCPSGQVVAEVKTDGSVTCASLTCPANTYFSGLNGVNPECLPLPTGSCPANQYVTMINADGTVVCAPLPLGSNVQCGAGNYLQAMVNGVHL